MDGELFMALVVLWIAAGLASVGFMCMWFANDMSSFHPHSVAMDTRHMLFGVVYSGTECKTDFLVKSISEFVAPRGSTSSKWFTVLCVVICVSGFFGTYRWYKVLGESITTEVILGEKGIRSEVYFLSTGSTYFCIVIFCSELWLRVSTSSSLV